MVKSQQKARGIPVWGARLKELRKRRGWTQQELASQSGYCERLVRKAELNGTVSEETLEVLAITLSDSNLRISIDDLSLSSRATAVALDEAIFSPAQSTLESLIHHANAQVTIDCSLVDGRLPLSGVFHRQRGLVDWYTVLMCLVKMDNILVKDHVLLDNARLGYIHASVDYLLPSLTSIQFDIDIRVHFRKSLIHRIVWLSSLSNLVPFAREWEQLVKSQYQQQIKKLCQTEHAQHSA
jgi:transcriptional regulator with XRE-family HTH domain